MGTKRRRVKKPATTDDTEAKPAKTKVNVPAHDGPGASSLGDDYAEAASIELDEQAQQAIDRDDEHDRRIRTGGEPYKPGDIAKAVADLKGELEPGTSIRVVYGPEKFSPVQFHTLDIGGGFIDVKVREGETAMDAWRRGFKILQQMADAEFKAKLTAFTKRIAEADAHVRANAAK